MTQIVAKRDSMRNRFPSIATFFPDWRNWSSGFDGDWEVLDDLRDALTRNAPTYPPCNIKKVADNKYEIDMAVVGFDKSDLEIEVNGRELTVEGDKESSEESTEIDYVYKGIATRHFRQTFTLGEHVKVKKSQMRDGMLRIELESEMPEKEKSEKVPIE